MLNVNQITHSYDSRPLLENITLTLHPGQRMALMGPSGCGKTTLLRIILGLLTPNFGTVSNTFPKTAVVFQEPRLLPWATAAENVNLVLGDRPQTLGKAKDTLALLGLGDAADKYPGELSGGMQQRVAIARALALDADLLILDEPFKAMDEHLQNEVIELVAKTDAAILLVTHEESHAAALGCKIFRLPSNR